MTRLADAARSASAALDRRSVEATVIAALLHQQQTRDRLLEAHFELKASCLRCLAVILGAR